jgi:hypothetical protein
MGTKGSERLSMGMVVLFRLGLTAGIGALLYLHTTYMSKEAFSQWEKSHIELRNTMMRNIDGRFDSMQIQLNRIESKVERKPRL